MSSQRFLDSERQQPCIPETSLIPDPLELQLGPTINIGALRDDAGSSTRAQRTGIIDSESVEISAQNQQRPTDLGSQPPNVITEGTSSSVQLCVAPVVPPPRPTYTCPICLGPLVEETTTSCGHIFCKDCIDSALLSLGRCPMCRRKIKARELHRVFFSDPL